MIHRKLELPKESFFLFGPRATGKTTWLKEQVKADLYIDLLKSKDFLRFSQNPGDLSELVAANPKWRSIVIDEIQKVPQLLDEVHSLIFESKNKLKFILTGSSARRLKNKASNLLAGRALLRKFHPLSLYELKKKNSLEEILRFGMLPRVWGLSTIEDKIDYLYSYVDTYLKEEIQQEALTRNLPAYSKFLEHMALRNSQVINLQNLSQQIGVARTTLNGYLQILEDTLLGFVLQPIQLKAKVKEVATPKFYFFDIGVVNTLSHSIEDKIGSEKGSLLETYILHELMTFSDYSNKRWQFFYWGTPGETEVDFIISSGKKNIGIEVKASLHWEKSYSYGLNELLKAKKINRAFGVYMGDEIIKKDNVLVIPAKIFSTYLNEKEIFSV
jgi:predicted AAA+ superfamily ATPase